MAAPCAEVKFLRFEPAGTPVFCVDGFQFADSLVTEHYFLSHFHSDHTVGLTKGFAEGTIYCSPITARLVREFIRVEPERIRELPLEEPVEVAGVRVTLVDANHCPGAVVFLFHHLATGRTAVHTGDLRAAACVREALLGQLRAQGLGPVHELFLDTTYASTRWDLPPQPEVLDALGALCAKEVQKQPRTLFIVGSYQIGKERAAAAIGRSVGSSVWAASRRYQMLEACGWAQEKINSDSNKMLFTTDSLGCNVRMENMMALSHERLLSTLEHAKGGFDTVCAFRPTGWTFSKTWRKFRPWVENDGRTKVFSIPYSEHSSVSELRDFVAALRPQKVIPTVNVERTQKMIDMFAAGMDLSGDRERLDWYLAGGSKPSGQQPQQQLVDVLQLSGGSTASRALPDAAAPIVLSDDEGGCGCAVGSSSSSSSAGVGGASSSAAAAAALGAEDLTCVDVAAQQRLLAFYAKQVAARSGGSKPVPEATKASFFTKAPRKRKASEMPPEKKVRPRPKPRPRPGEEEEDGGGEEQGRGKRFIPKPSAQVRERIDRAFRHRMYLLAARPEPPDTLAGPSARLDVLGSTGNVYTVTLGRPCQSCTCVDYTKQPNRVCKHILFVMLRVCRLPQNDPRVWQAALTPSEARPLVEALPSREELASQGDDVLASGPVLRGFDLARGDGEASQVQQRPLSEDPDCPICFEPLGGGAAGDGEAASPADDSVSWCRSCGHNAHRDCIRRWHGARGGASCPLCRGRWSGAAAEAESKEAPLNLSSLAGVAAPSLEELYPETHQWIGFRRRRPAGEMPPRAAAGGGGPGPPAPRLREDHRPGPLQEQPEARDRQRRPEPRELREHTSLQEESQQLQRQQQQQQQQQQLQPQPQPQPPQPQPQPQQQQQVCDPTPLQPEQLPDLAQVGPAASVATEPSAQTPAQSARKKSLVWARGRLAVATPSRALAPSGGASAPGTGPCVVMDLG